MLVQFFFENFVKIVDPAFSEKCGQIVEPTFLEKVLIQHLLKIVEKMFCQHSKKLVQYSSKMLVQYLLKIVEKMLGQHPKRFWFNIFQKCSLKKFGPTFTEQILVQQMLSIFFNQSKIVHELLVAGY
jgi:hypothetical protein